MKVGLFVFSHIATFCEVASTNSKGECSVACKSLVLKKKSSKKGLFFFLIYTSGLSFENNI